MGPQSLSRLWDLEFFPERIVMRLWAPEMEFQVSLGSMLRKLPLKHCSVMPTAVAGVLCPKGDMDMPPNTQLLLEQVLVAPTDEHRHRRGEEN